MTTDATSPEVVTRATANAEVSAPTGRNVDVNDLGGLGDDVEVNDSHTTADRRTGIVLLGCALLGGAAALVLAVEKFRVLTNPFYVPSCSVNEKISCLSVMGSPQAELLGFPNPLVGLLAFGALAAAAAAVVAARGPLARWFWAGLQVGTTAGLVAVHWLAWQSSLVIGALCPYCMAVWAVTITAFVHVTARTLSSRASGAAAGAQPRSLATRPSVVSLLWVLLLLSAAITATMAG